MQKHKALFKPIERQDSMHPKHIGARNELLACAWLLAQGYEVFRNVSNHGIVDIVGMQGGGFTRFDVKTAGVGLRRLSPEQIAANVHLLIVHSDGSCQIIPPEIQPRRFTHCLGPNCGVAFPRPRSTKLYCSPSCRKRASVFVAVSAPGPLPL